MAGGFLFTTKKSSNKPKPPPPHQQQYYRSKTFSKFIPVALAYSLVTHTGLLLSRPFFRFKVAGIPRPEDCFRLGGGNVSESPGTNENVAIVTGSNTGLGFETASSLVDLGYDVVLACRDREKGEKAALLINEKEDEDAVVTQKRGKAVFLHPLDLSSFQSVKEFHKCFVKEYSHLNILVNNAGMNNKRGVSIDGMNLCFQINFVGHYLLTRLLIPHLSKAKNSFLKSTESNRDVEAGRVVNLSSVTHHFASCLEERTIENNDIALMSSEHNREWWNGCAMPDVSGNVYKESKLAMAVFTNELNNRYSQQGVRAISANPGSVSSDIWRKKPKYMQKLYRLLYLSAKAGSTTSVAAAVGRLPQDAVYLQPYWQPFRQHSRKKGKTSFGKKYSVPLPFTEMLGPYIGYAVTNPRLPSNVDSSSSQLWDAFDDIVPK